MIQSLERAFLILETLDEAGPDGVGVQDLSRRVGLKFPTTHNFLRSMLQLGYVSQREDTGKYCLGDKAFVLGYKRESRKMLSEIARPIAEDLSRKVGETVVLAFYANRAWHTLFHCSSAGLNISPQLPVSKNLYISATGRCIMSRLPDYELENYIREQGLPGDDWDGVDTREDLDARLAEIRKRGYEIYDKNDGALGVAFPIHSGAKNLDASIGVYMLKSGFSGARKKTVVDGLREAASAILSIYEK